MLRFGSIGWAAAALLALLACNGDVSSGENVGGQGGSNQGGHDTGGTSQGGTSQGGQGQGGGAPSTCNGARIPPPLGAVACNGGSTAVSSGGMQVCATACYDDVGSVYEAECSGTTCACKYYGFSGQGGNSNSSVAVGPTSTGVGTTSAGTGGTSSTSGGTGGTSSTGSGTTTATTGGGPTSGSGGAATTGTTSGGGASTSSAGPTSSSTGPPEPLDYVVCTCELTEEACSAGFQHCCPAPWQ